MGYFGCAYVVECSADPDGITLTTTVLSPQGGKKVLFFWSEGQRPEGLHSYASGSLLCSARLFALPGYPSTERRGGAVGESADLVLVEESFQAQQNDEPVIFHFLLPPRFVPRSNRQPLVTPSRSSVVQRGDRLSATFVAKGAADVAFWMARLEANESLDDYDLTRLFDKPSVRSTKASMEINLGIVKVSFGEK